MKDFSFEMAQSLREHHCDKKHIAGHQCCGEVTIKRGEVCLSCVLCGRGEDRPGWSSDVEHRCSQIFNAAGISWDSLATDVKVRAMQAYCREAGE